MAKAIQAHRGKGRRYAAAVDPAHGANCNTARRIQQPLTHRLVEDHDRRDDQAWTLLLLLLLLVLGAAQPEALHHLHAHAQAQQRPQENPLQSCIGYSAQTIYETCFLLYIGSASEPPN